MKLQESERCCLLMKALSIKDANHILQIQLNNQASDDFLQWNYIPSRFYRVFLGYQMLICSGDSDVHDQIYRRTSTLENIS